MRLFWILTLAAAGFAACTEQTTYPVTGIECGPDDPVRTIDASDCVPPVR